MTGFAALIFVLVLVSVAGALVAIFVPVYQCPNCHSYDVREVEDRFLEDGEESLTCKSCDHTWRAV